MFGRVWLQPQGSMETEVLVDASGGWNQGIPLHSLNAAAIAKAGRQRPTNNALLCVSIPVLRRFVRQVCCPEAISGTAKHGSTGPGRRVCMVAAMNPLKGLSLATLTLLAN